MLLLVDSTGLKLCGARAAAATADWRPAAGFYPTKRSPDSAVVRS